MLPTSRPIPLLSAVLGVFLLANVLPRLHAEDSNGLLLGKSYPLQISLSHHVALFHWVDSLAGTSGGKTIPVYQKDFLSRFGMMTPTERDLLERFREARGHDSRRPLPAASGGSLTPRGSGLLRHTFLEMEDLDSALAKAQSEMDERDFGVLREALDYFRPKYETIWKDGSMVQRFLTRIRQDSGKKKLERLLSDMARAFQVDLSSASRPTVFPVPVPPGGGTHALASGPYLLIEVRPEDDLAETASVIVHENAHYLFLNMDQERRRSFELLVASTPSPAQEAWHVLHEALPTALGQGVADQTFRPRAWSQEIRWYHTEKVDSYAKALYPMVRDLLKKDGRFDESFLKEALSLYPTE